VGHESSAYAPLPISRTGPHRAPAGHRGSWTVARPPGLLNRPLTKVYRTAVGANVARGRSIGRADVADAMLAMVDDPATEGRAVGVAV
jgi:hypothetical protein